MQLLPVVLFLGTAMQTATTQFSDVTPCDLSEYGCCRDGINKALDKEGQGCAQVDICRMPPVTGTGQSAIPRWFYNSQTGFCENFLYGGFGGNNNNFETRETCVETCHEGNQTQADEGIVTVEVGNSVHVSCMIPLNAEKVIWLYAADGEDTIPRLLDEDDTRAGRFTISQKEELSNLAIDDIRMEDSGIYVCQASLRDSKEVLANYIPIKVTNRANKDRESDAAPLGDNHFKFDMTTALPAAISEVPQTSGTKVTVAAINITDKSGINITDKSGINITDKSGIRTDHRMFSSGHGDDEDVGNGEAGGYEPPVLPFAAPPVTSSFTDEDFTQTGGENNNPINSLGADGSNTDEEGEGVEVVGVSSGGHSMHGDTSEGKANRFDNGSQDTHVAGAPASTTSHATSPNGFNVDVIFNSCARSRYGCCPDEVSLSEGPNFAGCPDLKSEYTLKAYPGDVLVTKRSEADGIVKVLVNWSLPSERAIVDMYTVYYTTDVEQPLSDWKSVDSINSYALVEVHPDRTTFFKVRAFNKVHKSPISPTYRFNLHTGGVSNRLTGDCYGTDFGCCDDGLTSARGRYQDGCPEQKEAHATTSSSNSPLNLPPPPSNLKIVRNAVANDRVIVNLRWEKPTSDYLAQGYTIRFSNDPTLPVARWRAYQVKDQEWQMALRRGETFYFTISSIINGRETQPSPMYSYNTEEEMGRLYQTDCRTARFGCCPGTENPARGYNAEGCQLPALGGCASSRWGCCSDGVTSALGPDKLGCSSDKQPCDIAFYGCCLDGISEARGDNFEGCFESVQVNEADSCALSRFGCCSDGARLASGPEGAGCSDSRPTTSFCHLPSEIGPCSNHTIAWFFDTESGLCRRFWYGGCEGNSNRYRNQEECNQNCVTTEGQAVDACLQKPTVTGPCRGKFQRWSYNTQSGECEQFIYGGCKGSANRFSSLNECSGTCIDRAAISEADVCILEKEVGPCFASIPVWYFDSKIEACREFIYGGCGGNRNNFKTQALCENTCSSTTPSSFSADDCLLPSETGPCRRALLPSFFYNSTTGECQSFIYGGCAGNANRFGTMQECSAKCGIQGGSPTDFGKKEVCSLAKDSGPCKGYNIHWYYDSSTKRCDRFVYGGCRGNLNNYKTEKECETYCISPERDVCSLPPSAGPCFAYKPRWFYSEETRACQMFIYGGCAGNPNRFETEENCRSQCGSQAEDGTTSVVPTVTASVSPEEDGSKTLAFIGELGGSVVLPCNITSVSTTTVDWFKNRRPVATGDRYSIREDKSLEIRPLDSSDNAEFICRLRDNARQPSILYMTLQVEAEASIETGPRILYARSGERVTLPCLAAGFPTPTITWLLRGRKLSTDQKFQIGSDNSLVIMRMNTTDEGDYECHAVNKINIAKKITRVLVKDPMSISLSDHNSSLLEGDNLTLTCEVDSYPPARVKWLKDNVQVLQQENIQLAGTSLFVVGLVEQNEGTYSCIASNGREEQMIATKISVSPVVTKPPVPASCEDKPHLANCNLVVRHNYCGHFVYQHFCCVSCLKAGKFSNRKRRSRISRSVASLIKPR